MSSTDLALLILAASVPVIALSMGAAFWFIFKQQEKHLLSVLDRFLSRNMSEYGMTDLVKKEIEAEQDTEQGDEVDEDKVFEEYLKKQNAAAILAGVRD